MVNTNKCDKNIMSCDENFNCRYELFPPDRFSWFGDSTFTFSHCFVSPRIITESHESSHIFTSKCKVSDWFCLLKDSIIVWPKSVVQECPFKRVSIGFFDAIGSILMERTQKLGFQLKSIEHHCGYEFLYTTEGLYIASIYASNLINLEKFDTYVDTRGLLDLNLADEDFRAIDLIMDEKATLLRECNLFRTQLNLFSLAENSFLRIKDFKKNELILYTLGSQIYKPRCLKISKIKLVRSDNCYKYIPIQFYLNSYWKNGFLTNDRIITGFSEKITCTDLPKIINVPSLNKTIMCSHGISTLWETKNVLFDKLDFYDDVSFKNYSHVNTLVNGIDIIGQIHNLSVITENGNQWMVISDENSKQGNLGYVFSTIKDWFLRFSWSFLKWLLIALVIAIFCFIGYKVFLLGLKNYCAKRGNKSTKSVRYTVGDLKNTESINLNSPSIPFSNLRNGKQFKPILKPEPVNFDRSFLTKSNLSINTMSAV